MFVFGIWSKDGGSHGGIRSPLQNSTAHHCTCTVHNLNGYCMAPPRWLPFPIPTCDPKVLSTLAFNGVHVSLSSLPLVELAPDPASHTSEYDDTLLITTRIPVQLKYCGLVCYSVPPHDYTS